MRTLSAAAFRAMLIYGLWAMAWTGQPLAYATTGSGISVFDTGNNALLGTIPCCGDAAVAPDGKLVYAFDNNFSDTLIKISVIDAGTNYVVTQVPLDVSFLGNAQSLNFNSRSIAVSPDGKYIYAATGYCFSGSFSCSTPSSLNFVVWVIDTLTLKVVNDIEGDNFGAYGVAVGIAFTPDGKHAYVTASDPYYYAPPPLASVLVVDTVNFSVTQVPLPGYSVGGIAITPDGKYAYVAGTDSGIIVLDNAKLLVTAQIPVAGGGIAITPDGKHGYVGNSVIETATNTVVATLPVTGNGPAITPDGEHVYLANTVIETATNTVVATLPVTGSWAIIPPPAGVPFMAFTSKLNINLSPKQHQDAFDLESSFILSSKASNGIHPGIEPVELQVGPFITTIPAGSFKKRPDSSYTYEGMSNGVKLAVKIDLTGTLRYRLRAKITDANLSGITNPVQVSLSVGGGAGLVSVKADLGRHAHVPDDILN